MADKADLIIDNARVLTLDETQPRAEAIAIAGNRILAIGSSDDVLAHNGPETRMIDAQGGSVLPGFVESHIHIFSGGLQLESLSLEGLAGFDPVADAIRAHAQRIGGKGLFLVEQAQYASFGADIAINRQLLDRILPERPFALYAGDHHTMWANSLALEQAGLLHGAPMPKGSDVVMGEDGTATGELREFDAFAPLVAMTPTKGRELLGLSTGRSPEITPSPAERALDQAIMQRGLNYCASLGITSFHNMDGSRYQMELLEAIDRTSGLNMRVRMPFRLLPGNPLSDLAEAASQRRRFKRDLLQLDFVKLFMDGVIESTTALMLEDYCGLPGERGMAMFEQAEFNALCIEADRLGFQIATHAVGDAAVRRTLDGYEAARRANGPRDSRHRVEHIEVLHPGDLRRFAQLNVLASVQPTHASGGSYSDEPMLSLVGSDRMMLAYPYQTMRKSGARLVFSSDWPVAPLDPLLGIRIAMTRQSNLEDAPDQRQSLREAISGFTADGAYAGFMEKELGQLRVGMLADIVVLDGDIEAIASGEIDQLKVQTTICNGRITYQA